MEKSKCCGAEALRQVGGKYGCKKCESYCEIIENNKMNPLITKAIEMLPKEMEQTKEESDTEWFLAYGYNQALNDCKQSLPQVMEVIKGEIEEKLKDIDSATNPMWIRKQIIDLITTKAKNEKNS